MKLNRITRDTARLLRNVPEIVAAKFPQYPGLAEDIRAELAARLLEGDAAVRAMLTAEGMTDADLEAMADEFGPEAWE